MRGAKLSTIWKGAFATAERAKEMAAALAETQLNATPEAPSYVIFAEGRFEIIVPYVQLGARNFSTERAPNGAGNSGPPG